jgi:hypothetical protein
VLPGVYLHGGDTDSDTPEPAHKIIDLFSEHVRTMTKRSTRLHSGDQDRSPLDSILTSCLSQFLSGYYFHVQERVIRSGMTTARVDKRPCRQVLLRNGVRVSVVIRQHWPASDPIVRTCMPACRHRANSRREAETEV